MQDPRESTTLVRAFLDTESTQIAERLTALTSMAPTYVVGSRLDKALADREAYQVGLSLEAKFAQEIRAVRFGRARTDEKFLGDLAVRAAFGGKLHHHAFALRQ